MPKEILDFITNWLMGIMAAAIVALWRWTWRKVKETDNTFKTMKEADIAILHDRLYQSCLYYIHQNHIDHDGLQNIEILYKTYSKLGGNGTGTTLYHKACELPITDDDKII